MTAPVLLDMTRAAGRRWTGRTASGIDRVCDAYALHLGEKARAVLQIGGNARILDDAASRALFATLEAPTSVFRREFARILLAPAQQVRGAAYLNVGHSGFDAKAHWAWVARQRLAPVYLLHDLIPITHPHVTTPRKTARHRERVVRALTGGAGLIANSHATAHALEEFAHNEGLPVPPLLVAPIAGGLPMIEARIVPSDRPMFVSVGTIETRKNHVLLLSAWRTLIARMGDAAPRLVLAGNWGKGGNPVRTALRRDSRLARFVEVRCGLDDTAIAALVAQARAVLLPTFAEGFGMPLIEALSLRVPVIASDLPSLREIGQGIPLFLDSDDPEPWAAAIADFCGDAPERQRQMAMMPRFRPPSWTSHFAAFEAWLEELRIKPTAAVRVAASRAPNRSARLHQSFTAASAIEGAGGRNPSC